VKCHCLAVPLSGSAVVWQCRCLAVPLSGSAIVWQCHCLAVPLSGSAVVWECHCLTVPLYSSAIVQQCHCLAVPLSSCAIVWHCHCFVQCHWIGIPAIWESIIDEWAHGPMRCLTISMSLHSSFHCFWCYYNDTFKFKKIINSPGCLNQSFHA
jgi:hypothetical protein